MGWKIDGKRSPAIEQSSPRGTTVIPLLTVDASAAATVSWIFLISSMRLLRYSCRSELVFIQN
jgi:hypothetical protein